MSDESEILAKYGAQLPKKTESEADVLARYGASAEAEERDQRIANRPKSGYEGVPDDQLNFVQKAERFLIPPSHYGHEWFSPNTIEHTKNYAGKIATGMAAGAALSNVPILDKLAGSGVDKAANVFVRALKASPLKTAGKLMKRPETWPVVGTGYWAAKKLGLID